VSLSKNVPKSSKRVQDLGVRINIELPHERQSLPLARGWLRVHASAFGLDEEETETAALLLSEGVTNALLHSGAPKGSTISLSMWTSEHCVYVRVEDQGRYVPREEPRPAHGQGLTIVEALSESFDIQTTEAGTVLTIKLQATAVVLV
jgi:anti-sigma regulatory factor (Ser/Thr protein kinase)